MVTRDGQWVTYNGGETFSLVPGYKPEPPRHDALEVDDQGRHICPYLCDHCREVMFYGPANDEGKPTHKPSEWLTLVIDHRMHCAATPDHQGPP
jgi:hypothetical protein